VQILVLIGWIQESMVLCLRFWPAPVHQLFDL
jgi:hypothetical protein